MQKLTKDGAHNFLFMRSTCIKCIFKATTKKGIMLRMLYVKIERQQNHDDDGIRNISCFIIIIFHVIWKVLLFPSYFLQCYLFIINFLCYVFVLLFFISGIISYCLCCYNFRDGVMWCVLGSSFALTTILLLLVLFLLLLFHVFPSSSHHLIHYRQYFLILIIPGGIYL